MSEFEASVLKGLDACGIKLNSIAACGGVIGAAVSGGADSVSLLVSLCALCKQYSIPLKVITVNHYIREESETCGDVQFVKELCESLSKQGFELSLEICELKKGDVAALSEKKTDWYRSGCP